MIESPLVVSTNTDHPNHIVELLDKMGIGKDAVDKLAGAEERKLLFSPQLKWLVPSLRKMGLKVSAEPASKPISIAIETRALELRNFDPIYRKANGLIVMPETFGEIHDTLKSLSNNRRPKGGSKRASPRTLAAYMNESMIPAPGDKKGSGWSSELVLKFMQPQEDRERPVKIPPRCLREWRQYATSQFLTDLIWFDPSARVRWRFEVKQDDKITTVTSCRVPWIIYETARQSVESQSDLTGMWKWE